MIVLLNAMIPLPGERPGQWWDAAGSGAARRAADEAAGRDPEFDMERHFFHDLPDHVRAQMLQDPPPREPADTIFGQPCDIERWPDVTTHVIAGRDDRFFPLEFQQRLSRDRLGIEPEVVPGGHLLAKSRPHELADQLEAFLG
jgi:pimeloyl-ACP methyl ester carboxylesterase